MASTEASSERSYAQITDADLSRLSKLAADDRAGRFTRKPRWLVYAGRVIAVALCQGAASHYVDGRTGVKDFDVYTFYAEHPEGPFPYRWRTNGDFGPSHFGRRDGEPETYRGRRIDFIGRSLDERVDADAVEAVTRYLSEARTGTARHLSEKAVVLFDPPELRGQVVWPASGLSASPARPRADRARR
jgi:hypothetical protein